jgi:hypothetical protein
MKGKGRKEIDKIHIVHHKSVEYHSSNGSHNFPIMEDLETFPTLDSATHPSLHYKLLIAYVNYKTYGLSELAIKLLLEFALNNFVKIKRICFE